MKSLLFIALDGLAEKETETLSIARELAMVDGYFGFKFNLDYMLNVHRNLKEIITNMYYFNGDHKFNRPIFADLKMFNGSRTMMNIVRDFVELETDFVNVYALADNLLSEVVQVAKGTKTKVLGLTVLTHFSEKYCQKHFKRTLKETVRHLSEVAIDSGCDGIILPGTMLDEVKDLNTIKVVPGVRPNWYKDNRHEEEIEPKIAIEKGANILVCGSPIMKSINKTESLKQILNEMFLD